MSYCSCKFFSRVLKNFVDVTVYIPSMSNGEAAFLTYDHLPEIHLQGKKFRTLYLLHGALDDSTAWLRRTMVSELAEKYQIALIMPSAQNSFYVNTVHGLEYHTFLNEELPIWAEQTFPLSTRSEDRYIAGYSMGGYGALRHGLSHPEKYAGIGFFSGGMDIPALRAVLEPLHYDAIPFDDNFGGTVEGTDNDLYALAKKCKESGVSIPKIYSGCGTEDNFCYDMNKKMVNYLQDIGYSLTYEEIPGMHEWKVWNQLVARFIVTVIVDK